MEINNNPWMRNLVFLFLFLVIIIFLSIFIPQWIEEKKASLGVFEAKETGFLGLQITKDNIHRSVNFLPEVKAYCIDICLTKNSPALKIEPISTEKFKCFCENSLGLYRKEAELDASKADEYDKEINAKDEFSHIEVQHWTHMPITYGIRDERKCGEFVAGQIEKAVSIIEDATDNIVRFEKVDKDPDIEFFCTFKRCKTGKMCLWDNLEHRLGDADYQVFDKRVYYAVIMLRGIGGYSEKGLDSGFYASTCDAAHVEVHEILHTFLGHRPELGLDDGHNDIPNSILSKQGHPNDGYIMTPEKCAKLTPRIIDDYIIEELKSNYGQNN